MIKRIVSIKRNSKKIPGQDAVKSALVATAGTLMRTQKSPDELLGEMFRDIQTMQVYSDGKTFADLVPKKRVKELIKEYQLSKLDPNFDLHEFVARHFYEFAPHKKHAVLIDDTANARQHVSNLWPQLKRRNRIDRGSLFALPHSYVVPGGRFSEQFYWDTYFIMLGLAADGEWSLIEGMIKNYAYMIRKFGFIPTANRTYFLSRSQPPFFSHMVKLLATHNGRKRTLLEYLPYMLSEYRFWMKGRKYSTDHPEHAAYGRVVRMPNGIFLNRYFDNKTTPRPEMMNDDIETAAEARTGNKEKIFLDLRAAAESGWDFSSRWFKDENNLHSIHTTDIVPVDLNCLLYHLEMTIAEAYDIIKQPLLRKKFANYAEKRRKAILEYCWDDELEMFCDYDFRAGHSTGRPSLASVFPLYVKIADGHQAEMTKKHLEKDFLKEGGLLSTLVDNGQQWDAPNGWAPLQWVAINGLREYGYYEFADEIRRRWLKSTEAVYKDRNKMIEKYNVMTPGALGAGGEYPVQDGFGWTNGVYAALKDED